MIPNQAVPRVRRKRDKQRQATAKHTKRVAGERTMVLIWRCGLVAERAASIKWLIC